MVELIKNFFAGMLALAIICGLVLACLANAIVLKIMACLIVVLVMISLGAAIRGDL